MSDKYRVTAIHVQQDGSFTAQSGEHVALTDYQLGLTNLSNGQEGIAWLSQKPETAPPTVGQEIEGDMSKIGGGPNKGHNKIKKVSNYQGGGAGPRNDPATQASIRRQTAAKCAAELLAGAVSSGKVTLDEALTKIEPATGKFLHAIEADQQQTTAQPTADVPADTGGLDGGPATDDDIPF